MTISLKDFQRWCRENAKLALAVLETQAAAEATKAKVAAYIQPIFDSFEFICSGPMAEQLDASPREGDTEPYVGRRITSPENSEFWMLHGKDMPEEVQAKLRAYYAACDAEHRRQGFNDLEPGHCPALQMESLHTEAENALIEFAQPLFGIEQVYGKNREKYLELLIGGCIKSLDEMQVECGNDGHTRGESNPIDPRRLRCSNCCADLGLRNAA